MPIENLENPRSFAELAISYLHKLAFPEDSPWTGETEASHLSLSHFLSFSLIFPVTQSARPPPIKGSQQPARPPPISRRFSPEWTFGDNLWLFALQAFNDVILGY